MSEHKERVRWAEGGGGGGGGGGGRGGGRGRDWGELWRDVLTVSRRTATRLSPRCCDCASVYGATDGVDEEDFTTCSLTTCSLLTLLLLGLH